MNIADTKCCALFARSLEREVVASSCELGISDGLARGVRSFAKSERRTIAVIQAWAASIFPGREEATPAIVQYQTAAAHTKELEARGRFERHGNSDLRRLSKR